MKRSLWISTLMAGVLVLAGVAAAGASKGCPGAPPDAAGLSGPRWECGVAGHAMKAPECDGTGMKAGRGCGMARGSECAVGQKTGRHAKCDAGRGACCMGRQGAGCDAGRGACCMGRQGAKCDGGRGAGRGPQDGPQCCPQRGPRAGQQCCPQAGMAPGRGMGGRAGDSEWGPGFGAGPEAGFGAAPGLEAMEKLDLTQAQREKLADLHERVMKQQIQTQADLRIAQMDLQKLMRAESPDGRAIDAQIDKIAGLRASIQKARVEARLAARTVLTPEQQKQLKEVRGSMPQGMRPGAGGRQGMGGCGGPGPQGGSGGPPDDDGDI
jgi:Spy/CpxP family protein refolding chaperone